MDLWVCAARGGDRSGPAGTYTWSHGNLGCVVSGIASSGLFNGAHCFGGFGETLVCRCTVNEVELDFQFSSEGCANAGGQLAAGMCADAKAR
jgi:hypothetical protein